jgi:sigma-B regulation protein RsbU (phosphoserine phosphatase)
LRDESAKCYAYLGIIFDITDRKLAEQELAEKGKSIHRTLFEHTADPIVIFDKETHKFLDCNRAALRSYGYSIDEFRAMTPFDLHPREDRRKVNKNIDVRNVDVPNVYKHITKDGRKIDVEILSDETVYEGRAAWISIVHNITERKQAERKLAVLSEELKIKNEEMEKDLDMARDVQMALLSQHYPKNFPKNVPPEQSALQFSHRYIPASTLAGDFFEIFPISDHQVGVMIYDVMGHGVRASLLTAYLHGLVEQLMPSAGDPVIFIKRLNEGLSGIMEQFLAGMFATAFYVVADIKKGKMYFTNAGHPKPYIIRRSTGAVEKLGYGKKQTEPALGLFNRFNYTASECSMNKDDIILFFTDGVYEVENTEGQLFGEKQLMATVKNKLNTPPEQMLDEILQEINTFSGTDEFNDDVCLVSMHVRQI